MAKARLVLEAPTIVSRFPFALGVTLNTVAMAGGESLQDLVKLFRV